MSQRECLPIFSVPDKVDMAPAQIAKSSGESLTDQLAAFFRARPNEWIDARELLQRFGFGGWRTRISNARTEFGMVIENRQQRITTVKGKFTVSSYRYVPEREGA